MTNLSSQIQSVLSNSSESLILGQLGANSSLRFLGPNRGVIPISPNSIRGLYTPQHPPLSDAGENTAILSYNYTLYHQGITSDIRCIYDTQSPITYSVGPADDFGNITGSCNETGLTDFVTDSEGYRMLNTYRTLAVWVCYSQEALAYNIYLRGCGRVYEREIGNISCSLSSIQPAVFPVTYQSRTNVFSTQEPITAFETPSDFFYNFFAGPILSLWDVIWVAQNPTNNLAAELVKDPGIQALFLQPPNDQYLPLYEAMLQGIIADLVCIENYSSLPLLMDILQFTYKRFLYSMTSPPPPASCLRTVNGTMSAEVTGWVAKPVHIGFLMPMTILNLASFILVLLPIARQKTGIHEFDPTDPGSLVLAESRVNESEPTGWADGVTYRSREVRLCQI